MGCGADDSGGKEYSGYYSKITGYHSVCGVCCRNYRKYSVYEVDVIYDKAEQEKYGEHPEELGYYLNIAVGEFGEKLFFEYAKVVGKLRDRTLYQPQNGK